MITPPRGPADNDDAGDMADDAAHIVQLRWYVVKLTLLSMFNTQLWLFSRTRTRQLPQGSLGCCCYQSLAPG